MREKTVGRTGDVRKRAHKDHRSASSDSRNTEHERQWYARCTTGRVNWEFLSSRYLLSGQANSEETENYKQAQMDTKLALH